MLEERGIMVKPVFISIDPQRDTPEVMAEFTDYLHPRMLGLTGSEAQVRAASRAYRTYFQAQEARGGRRGFLSRGPFDHELSEPARPRFRRILPPRRVAGEDGRPHRLFRDAAG